jgi:arylsulfatase A-like enzyme
MVDALKAQGEYENTLIIFTSDHGEMLGDHWCWGKETPFDQAVHVPLIVRSPLTPSASRGRVLDYFSEHVDIMPTILDHLGAETPLQCDGRSMRTFIEGGEPPYWRDEVRWEFDFRSVTDEDVERLFGFSLDECSLAVVRTKYAKYVHFAALPALYFDLATDPGELHNLAGKPEMAGNILAMGQRMLTWRMVFNRRELTGIRVAEGTQIHAARSRRIV